MIKESVVFAYSLCTKKERFSSSIRKIASRRTEDVTEKLIWHSFLDRSLKRFKNDDRMLDEYGVM